MNRYYVAASSIADAIAVGADDPWTCATVDEAVRRAKFKMAEDGSNCAVVVQIIKVLRRPDPPVVIEDV